MGTFFQAFAHADFFGKVIFFALFLISCLCWVFLIQKLLVVKRALQKSKKFQRHVERNREEILNLTTHVSSPFCILYHSLKEKTVQLLDKNHYFSGELGGHQNHLSFADMEFLGSHLHAAVVKQREAIEKNLFILATTVTLAPFLGLLGTVWGILITFGELQAGHSASSNSVILGGLSTALTTTVLGLVIAIPALIAYSYLKNLSRSFTMQMHDFSHFLISTVELQYRKVDVR
ncbi:MAG: Biopolymer transport protein ExbB [Chlamydiae bacterium]|nr:Biopolymer transport protein ExbB [Chlamydiota bacterium]